MEKLRSHVGRDAGEIAGWLIAIAIKLFIIAMIVAAIVFAGSLVGLFHSIKNYGASFMENVVYDNTAA